MTIKKPQSLNKQFHRIMILGIALCIILAIGCLWVPSYIVFHQVASIKRQILLRDIKTIDSKLDDIKKEVVLTAVNNVSLSKMNKDLNDLQIYQAKQELVDDFRDIVSEQAVFAMFSYSAKNDIYISFFESGIHINERNKLKNLAKEYCETNEMWDTIEIAGKNYLGCFFSYVRNTVGVLVDLEDISEQELSNSLGNSFCILDDKGSILVETNSSSHVLTEISDLNKSMMVKKYVTIREKTDIGNLQIIIIYPYKEIFDGFYPIIYILSFVCICILGAMLYMVRIIKKMSLEPIGELLKGLDAIGESNFDYKITYSETYQEYLTLANTFNDISARLRHLQKDIYEKTIYEQKLELQYYRLKIRPHFLYNSLNIVCNLIQMGRNAEAKKLCTCLVKYFRHVLSDEDSFVFLGDEIEHAKNFAQIYGFRYSGKIQWDFNIEQEAYFIRIPSLMIHTLLENVVKHAFSGEKELVVSVSAIIKEKESQRQLLIRVKDNGPGFSEKALKEFYARMEEQSVFGDTKEKIGLLNISQRLRLLYGNRANVYCFNENAGGACIELLIPVDIDEGNAIKK